MMPGPGVRLDGKPTVNSEEGGIDEMVMVGYDGSIIGLMERIQNKEAGVMTKLKEEVGMTNERFTKAISRVCSLRSKKYQIERLRGGDVVDGGGVVLGRAGDYPGGGGDKDEFSENPCTNMWTASYAEWDASREYRDHFMLYSKSDLMSVVGETYDMGDEGKCQLLPRNMSMIPSLYWSIVYHFIDTQPIRNMESGFGDSIGDALLLMFPHRDWEFLNKRIRGVIDNV